MISLVLIAALTAQDAKSGAIAVRAPVLRAVPPGVPNTAGYMTIVNSGAAPDRLVSVACACARSVEAHQSHVMNGVSMMMGAGAVTIPAGGEIVFAPNGYHLMVMGLRAPLQDGSVQTLTLKFQHAGVIQAPFQVKSRIPLQPATPG